MNSTSKQWLGACLVLMLASLAGTAAAAPPKSFKVFNATHFKDTPDLSKYGILLIDLIYEDKLTDAPPPFSKTRAFSSAKIAHMAALAKQNPSILVSLDIESWGWTPAVMGRYADAVKQFKQVSPQSVVGLYGVMPSGNRALYMYYVNHDPKLLTYWQSLQVKGQTLSQKVDVFMPSLYTYGADLGAWESMAKTAIAAARQANPGKPVYAYIWPQYYPAEKDRSTPPYYFQFLPASFWRAELETLYPIADGVIIWSSNWTTTPDGQKTYPPFSTSMPWFVQTVAFMKKHDIH